MKTEELIGKTCHEIWKQSNGLSEDCPVVRAFKTQRPYHVERIAFDGRWFIVRVYPILSESSEITGLIEFRLDITDRKRAEEALRINEEKYRTLVENANDIIMRFDRENRHLYVSPSSKAVVDIEPDQFVGKTHRDLGFPEVDSFGQVTTILSVAQDITARKWAEEELKHYRDHLEELVEERTAELRYAQAELVRRERLAVLGQLTVTVSHEIRNPLGTIRTSLFSIEDAIHRKELERVDRALKLAKRNVERCNQILTELLDHTQQRELNPGPADIDPWLTSILNELELADSAELRQELRANINISIDRDQMRRAVVNVLTNAVHAMEDGESSKKILTVQTSTSRDRLEMRFSDTGPDIPEEIRQKIFEPLFSTRRFGFGLGMSVIKGVMEAHSGGVEIESRVGEGTVIVLWLPLAV